MYFGGIGTGKILFFLKEIFVDSLCDKFYKINKENMEEFIMTFRMGPSIEVRKKVGWGKEVYKEGKQEGLLEGKQEKNLEIAFKMKQKGLTTEFIQEITGLSKKEIEEL